ncbi:MAG: AmmeMemoRadiSam system protein B [Acidobacteria bacterium]|jgi:AmmeMemoRadiSam system protein B|nr:MAG: AmmeMemoRadiSam system protein B [Acidobacteriota bacterium]
MKVRKPVVAGSFYPSDPERLRTYVEKLMEDPPNLEGSMKGLISPHAGYMYSGYTAGRVYGLLMGKDYRRVLLIGPSHFVDFEGYSFGDFDLFETPLGAVKVDREAIFSFTEDRKYFDGLPHLYEHSLEVQLPFLQVVLGDFSLVPVVYGRVSSEEIAKLLENFCDGRTLFVISSDLSHYYDYATAKTLDGYCHLWITKGERQAKLRCEACGKIGIEGALIYAGSKGLRATLVDYRTSGDSGGGKERVVGYGGYAFISSYSTT